MQLRPALEDHQADVVTLSPQHAGRAAAAGMCVAYLTNVYPKPSHTFIRNEILALERQGLRVARITIRRPREELVDAADREEAEDTVALLSGNPVPLLIAVAGRLVQSPKRFAAALRAAMAGGAKSGRPLAAAMYFVEACRLAAMMEAAGLRHVHVHFGTNPAAVARLAAMLGALTYSVTMHGPDEFDAPAALQLPDKIADARFVAAVSSYGRSQLMRWSRIADWPKIAVVRCGVAPAFHVRVPVSGAGLRSRTLVCVARLSAQKGLPLLLEAAALVARTHGFQLRIVGDGELRPMLTARIAALGLAGPVRLLGWRDAAVVREEIMGARALVLPSFAEGLPIVLMEALALGRPVITTAIAGIPELVDARSGWLIPAGSVPALADAMKAALGAEPGELAAMAAHGRQRVCRLHDIDDNAAQLAALLRPLAKGGAG